MFPEQTILIYAIFAFLSTISVLLASTCFVETLQEMEYDGRAYLRYLKTTFRGDWVPFITTALVALLLKLAYAFLYGSNYMLAVICLYGADIVYICMLFSMYFSFRRSGPGLVRNGRTLAIFIILFVMIAGCASSIFMEDLNRMNPTLWEYMRCYLLYYMPGLLLPLFVWVANLITSPFIKKKQPVTLDAEQEKE